jgi:tRNA pseudouridine55 synthase
MSHHSIPTQHRPNNGWIILDKPLGLSSTQAMAKVKRLFKMKKAGHAGTLDPLASGVLPVALGEATKTIPFMMDASKTYEFCIGWGEQRTTDDAEGDVLFSSPHRPTRDDILSILSQFTGLITQIPPIFSAIRVQGERAYDLARQGIDIEMESRTVTIESLELIDFETAKFEVKCSKGTYVRSLARDIAKALGTYGYVSYLRRTAVGSMNQPISLENLQQLVHNGDKVLLPVSVVLDDIPAISVSEEDTIKIKRGQSIIAYSANGPCDQASVWHNDTLLALGFIDDWGLFHPKKGFNL